MSLSNRKTCLDCGRYLSGGFCLHCGNMNRLIKQATSHERERCLKILENAYVGLKYHKVAYEIGRQIRDAIRDGMEP